MVRPTEAETEVTPSLERCWWWWWSSGRRRLPRMKGVGVRSECARYDLELHVVHRNSQGKLAVIAILYDLGHSDSFLDKILANISHFLKGEEKIDLGVVNPWDINFGSKKYYIYMDSLTVPPCTEGVLWTLLDKVRTTSKEQIAALKKVVHDDFENNARPPQPLNDRIVSKYFQEIP
ncbi:alpha carbonic anhydrase 4-like [Salvia hispanica]|uniref:alpha carbonic anhydrase 4-like n=1 Tax=Salvia hispanica TaxID=49212 RepID=UPI002009942D|nr:alpha carbonic anhydrase 4-like [Salvia hispanica]